MNRKLLVNSALSIAVLLATAGVFRAQDTPEPPEPPEPPETHVLASPDEPEVMVFADGGARLGATLEEVNAQKARELKLPGEYGAIVERVERESAAAKAGLQKGDVILEYNGQRVWSARQLARMVRETPPSRTVSLQISRDGQTRTLSAKLEPRRNAFNFHGPDIHIPSMTIPDFDYRFFTPGARLGVSGDELTPQLATYFGVKQGKGVLVREVESGSAAAKAGIKAGDVITKVDNAEVGSVNDLRRSLPHDFEGTRKVTLTVVRDHHEQTVSVELQAPEQPGRELEREITLLKSQQLRNLATQVAQQKAELQKTVDLATRQWTQQYQNYMRDMQKSLQMLQKEIQKQKLQELRDRAPKADQI